MDYPRTWPHSVLKKSSDTQVDNQYRINTANGFLPISYLECSRIDRRLHSATHFDMLVRPHNFAYCVSVYKTRYVISATHIYNSRSKNVSPFGYHACGSTGYNDKLGTVHHIHGTLSSDLILGLNDPSQIANSLLTANKSLTDYIIKSQVNEALGERRVIDAKRIIDNSDYIGIYGMSLGDTDKMWWEYLLAWLQAKNTRRLVLYVHSRNPVDNPDSRMTTFCVQPSSIAKDSSAG